MYKIISVFFLALLLISCSSSNLIQNEFTNTKKHNTYDVCTNFSYISLSDDIKYGKIFSEYISLDSSCKWNGLASGFFVSLFMENIKAKSYKLVEQKSFKNIEVSTYKVDEQYYVNIIDKFTVLEDRLMVDYSGVYSTKLIQEFEENYINNYINMPRLESNYFSSLVRMNFFKFYFSKDSESFGR